MPKRIIYPPVHQKLLNTIEDLTEAAETGDPVYLREAAEITTYDGRSNYMSRARNLGEFGYGVSVDWRDVLQIKQSPRGEEPVTVRVQLNEGAEVHKSGTAWEQLKAMGKAATDGPQEWPGGASRTSTSIWNRKNSHCDFRRANGMVTFVDGGNGNG